MFARLFVWLRRHQRLVDLILMLPVGALSLAIRARYVEMTPRGFPISIPIYAHILLAAGTCVPLIWRRKWPVAVFALIALASFVQWLAGIEIAVDNVAVLIAMYTVAAERILRWALAAGFVTEIGMGLATYSMVEKSHSGEWKALFSDSIFIWGVWVSGMYMRTRRKYTLSLEERARRLERERDAQAEAAAAAERARIAREMHDVIAHSISVMVIQADGASYAIATDADRAKRAMQAIGSTGRQALTEMRRMLGVLRDGDAKAALAPQPGVDQLPDLIEQIRSTGMPVDLTIGGAMVPLPPGMELTIYRIVQEALTNVMKHAGPTASAHVRLDYGADEVEVRVRDDGRGVTFSDGHGHGLVSMRERIAVYGGQVTAAPARGGGFEVSARMPMRETPAKQEVSA